MTFEARPWGNFTVIYREENFQLKKIVIEPGKRISLQSHKFRSEHWFILSGSGIVQLDGKCFEVSTGDSIDVQIGIKHRISCTSIDSLVLIEVQTGYSFDENDIVRFQDDFVER